MIFEFLNFRLDPRARTVTRSGEPVPMTAKVFDTLLLLVRNAGQIVTKDEFLKTIWPGTVVEEANLSQNVFLLRKLLGEKESGQKIILTHTGAGYSFLPEVRVVVDTLSPELSPAIRPQRRWFWPALTLAALAVFASLAVSRGNWQGRSALEARKWAASTKPGVESYPALSPDGSRLAFTWDGGTLGASASLYLQKLPSRNDPLLPASRLTKDDGDGIACPAWSLDGQRIAFVRQGPSRAAVYTISAEGTEERKIRDLPPATLAYTGCVVAFSADGTSLAVATAGAAMQTHLIRVALATGVEEPMIPAPEGIHSGDAHPAYSPDGRYLAFLRRDTRASMDIYLVAAAADGRASGEPRRLTVERLLMHGIAWSPDSKSIVYSATRQGTVALWRIPVNGGISEAVPGGDMGQYPTISRNARLSFTVLTENRNLWKLPLSSQGVPEAPPSPLLSSTRKDEGPVYSRDGRRLSFFSDRTGSYEIWSCESDGSRPRALTSFGGAFAGLTDWSLDGKTILFDVVTPNGSQDIWTVPAFGGKAEPLITGPGLEAVPTFSRDDRSIYFSSTRSGRFQIWRADRQGGNLAQITKQGGLAAREAEDGYLYYSTQVNVPEIRRVPVNGGMEETILSDPRPRFFGHWVLRRGRIYFIRQPDDSMYDGTRSSELWAYELNTRRARKLADLPGWVHHTTPSLAVSPDGGMVVYSRIDSASGDLYVIDN
ncbi:MAG: winged helix-turn-helix domain-containing protein [Bryobacteraceae bacterium]